MKIIWLLVFLALMISADGSRVGRYSSMQSGDSVESNQACGASGYTLDAPIPEVMFRKVRKKRRMRRAATNDGFKTWPQGKIPYTLSEKFSNTKRRLIRRSMKHWMNQTCVQFVPRTTEPDYIHIYGGNGCCSYVGRRGGKQYVSLGNGCNRFGIITHELGHAVGFWHEQNRPDRFIYVDVIYDNVDSSKYLNFDPRDSTEVDTFDQNYDFSSIMHYGSSFFSKNGGDTITAKLNARNAREELTKRIGSSYYKFKGPVLSTQDIIETNLLYKCSKLTQECGGGTIFSSSGTFTSQNHPREYPLHTKQDCVWVLTTTTKSQGRKSSLTLQFHDFHVGNAPVLERHHSACPDDYVEVREGKGFLSPFLVRYCGNRLPAPITTLTGSLYVRFHVSGKNANQADQLFSGFKAKFKTDVCSSHLQKFPATIQSTDFPFGYKRSTDCLWVVEALPGMQIEIKFPFFSLREHNDRERCSDYLEIHKGDKQEEVFVGRYCGTKNPGTLLIRSENVKLHFHSSDLKESGWFLGFQAQINQLDINECSQGLHECQHDCLNYPGGYFCGCHPGYKRSYLGDSNKAQCIDVDECSVNNGGCSHACANTDGSFVCACPEGYTLSENRTICIDINECILPNRMCNQICTNTIGSYKCSCYEGFILQSNNYTCSGLIGCQGTMQSSSGRITPPIIPPSYAHILRCVWRVIAPSHLRLAFQVILPWQQNNNCSSFLTFHDNERKHRRRIDTKKVCQLSDAADSLVMSGNTAVIEYVAQAPFQAPFKLQFYSVAPPKPQCLHTFNTTSGKFHTPGFPYKYPDHQECVWNIHAPSKKPFLVKVSAFRVEYHARCKYDFLDVEEVYYHVRAVKKIGRFCGTQGPQILRVDGGTCFLRLRFHSDATNAETGFKVEFTESGNL